MSVTAARQPKPQTVLHVIGTRWITPHLVRVVAAAPSLQEFRENGFTDRYVKIHFAKPELKLTPPYDLQLLRQRLAPGDVPVTRTYTVRWVDYAQSRLAIDFVVHGDEGIAGPWAAAAQPGDILVVTGPGGGFAPDPSADWYLFAGDDSALPAISSALEVLPEHAVGVAYLEVNDAADVHPLAVPAGVSVTWLYRHGAAPGAQTLLADAVGQGPWLPGRVQVFAHGEREAMKALRDVFFAGKGLDRNQVSLSGYWAYGRTEDRFQSEKREPVGKILPD